MTFSPQDIRAFVQARMASSRLPGKVLAPLAGKPMIRHVIERVAQVVPKEQIVVVTSDEASDDPLSSYIQALGGTVFRGPQEDVFTRFRLCLKVHACTWFFRVSGDSPLFDARIVAAMFPYAGMKSVDLVTNVQKRTFPHGHSVEMVRASRFVTLDGSLLTADEREHVTLYYYAHPGEFKILNLENANSIYGAQRLVVDTLEDFRRIEHYLLSGKPVGDPRIVLPIEQSA
jgi:spore coat polysaccharide biosynthesis protein SpsF